MVAELYPERVGSHHPVTTQGVKEELQNQVVLAVTAAEDVNGPADTGFAWGRRAKPKEITKEGLSEYFIYTIEGTETINNGWSKRMRSFEGKDVGFKIQYRYRPAEYGDQLVRMYLLTNDKESKLGTTPLPNGVVRVFRDNGRDGLSYLAEQTVKYNRGYFITAVGCPFYFLLALRLIRHRPGNE
jgi:hypothetical protein